MKDKKKFKRVKAQRRAVRTRSKMFGIAGKPRVSVFRSLSHIYVQAIDDNKRTTIVAASDKEIKTKGNKTDKAALVGEAMGRKLLDKKISSIFFDRGAYKYHGRVKALAEGMRKAGVIF
ncbi:MAG: 50S ribosomal protein L18 [Patescibacteria group bacterium]|nr:50S ribosomal protein L18 [Patescibacteria group bacterium]